VLPTTFFLGAVHLRLYQNNWDLIKFLSLDRQ